MNPKHCLEGVLTNQHSSLAAPFLLNEKSSGHVITMGIHRVQLSTRMLIRCQSWHRWIICMHTKQGCSAYSILMGHLRHSYMWLYSRRGHLTPSSSHVRRRTVTHLQREPKYNTLPEFNIRLQKNCLGRKPNHIWQPDLIIVYYSSGIHSENIADSSLSQSFRVLRVHYMLTWNGQWRGKWICSCQDMNKTCCLCFSVVALDFQLSMTSQKKTYCETISTVWFIRITNPPSCC